MSEAAQDPSSRLQSPLPLQAMGPLPGKGTGQGPMRAGQAPFLTGPAQSSRVLERSSRLPLNCCCSRGWSLEFDLYRTFLSSRQGGRASAVLCYSLLPRTGNPRGLPSHSHCLRPLKSPRPSGGRACMLKKVRSLRPETPTV